MLELKKDPIYYAVILHSIFEFVDEYQQQKFEHFLHLQQMQILLDPVFENHDKLHRKQDQFLNSIL